MARRAASAKLGFRIESSWVRTSIPGGAVSVGSKDVSVVVKGVALIAHGVSSSHSLLLHRTSYKQAISFNAISFQNSSIKYSFVFSMGDFIVVHLYYHTSCCLENS